MGGHIEDIWGGQCCFLLKKNGLGGDRMVMGGHMGGHTEDIWGNMPRLNVQDIWGNKWGDIWGDI
jgi:hypothetical protein